jgi:FMN phosphatase YigB (HAD superfamily)
MNKSTLYDRDFHEWTQVMADAIRSEDWENLDIENLAEELESLGRQQRQELRNRLGVLLGHLLKWQYQPQNRSKSWRLTLREQRLQIQFLLKDNPSLKPYLTEAIKEGYALGLLLVAKETPLDIEDLPGVCPYSLEEAIDDTFLPD